MTPVLSVENMRRSDAHTIEATTPSRELMFLAGKSIYENVAWKPPIAIVCGSGNNAGDGYVVAQLLADDNVECTVFMLTDKTSQDGAFYLEGCRKRGMDIRDIGCKPDFSGFNTILDCIFGTGFKGCVEGMAKDAIEAINSSGAYVVSADINSGLGGDSGTSSLCVESDLTISIGGYKPGHFLNMAKDVMKRTINCDIGIEPVQMPYWLLGHDDFTGIFKPRRNYSNKGSYGYTALVGGSKRYSGAIRLASMANAAMRSGAGVVKVAVPDSLAGMVSASILESTLFPLSDDNGDIVFVKDEVDELMSNTRTMAFGMGIGVSIQTTKMLDYILAQYTGTLIVDADGLTILSSLANENPGCLTNARCRIVLTPHAKEFSRLIGVPMETYMHNPMEAAKGYAMKTGAIVLLKGPTTIVTDGVRVYLTNSGCAGMATAGSGDVLSGILAAICSWGCFPSKNGDDGDLLLAVAAGAYINGRAGEIAQSRSNPISMTAGDTAAAIADAVGEYFAK